MTSTRPVRSIETEWLDLVEAPYLGAPLAYSVYEDRDEGGWYAEVFDLNGRTIGYSNTFATECEANSAGADAARYIPQGHRP